MELLSGLNGWLAIALGGLITVIAAVFGGRQWGASSERKSADLRQARRDAQQAESIRRAVEERGNADAETDRLPDGGALDELRRDWARRD